MKKTIAILSVTTVLLAGVLAGCGSKKSESATTTTTTTRYTTTTTEKENVEDKITSVLEDATSIFDKESTAVGTTK